MKENKLIEFSCIDRGRTDRHGNFLEFIRHTHTPQAAAKSVAEYLAECERNINEFWIEVYEPDRKTPHIFKAVRDPRPRLQVTDYTNDAVEASARGK